MHELRDVVDLWKVGKLNHDKEREAAIDWESVLPNWKLAAGLRSSTGLVRRCRKFPYRLMNSRRIDNAVPVEYTNVLAFRVAQRVL